MSSREADAIEMESESHTTREASEMDTADGNTNATTHSNSGVYETRYQKSLRHYLTREALPKESHYRNLDSIVDGKARPTLDDLHHTTLREKQEPTDADPEAAAAALGGKVIKFGWLEGVFMRCTLNIWGVMLFLRVTWLVGQAGIILALGTVILANGVTTITTLSMSAVATNGRIRAGGIYYMISRSLGPEFGASIGLMFTVANSVASATHIIGFCDGMKDLLKEYFHGTVIVDGAVNDTRVVGVVTLICVLVLVIVGMDWVTRVQMSLMALLIASQLDLVVGAFMGPRGDIQKAQGFIGFNAEVMAKNVGPDYRVSEGREMNFFSVFGVFFTAVTGIVAGANLSGDLKDPAEAIPKGTLLAILTTFTCYVVYILLIGATLLRDATGDLALYIAHKNGSIWDNPAFTNCSTTGYNDSQGHPVCEFGSQNDYQAMKLMSAWGPLIYAGCFAATLSSAITTVVGAPRVLQALAKDKLYPGIYMFSKGRGANNDPVRGYILVFFISFTCIMIGDLNLVATLLANFFLAAYSLINFSCFHASLIKSPGWRPSFKYYNLWVSLIGGIMCLCVMFLIDWTTALITFIITIALYLYVSHRNLDVNWGSSTQGQTYVSALKTTLDLSSVEDHVKNYRPQLLVLTGPVGSRPPLLDFAFSITKNISLLSCGHIIQGPQTQRVRNTINGQAYRWLKRHHVRAFYSLIEGKTLEEGAKNLFQLVGLGKLRPNTVMLGYKANWRKCDPSELKSYFNTLHEALDMYFAVIILRVPQGLDYSQITEDEDSPITMNGNESNITHTPENKSDQSTANQLTKDGIDNEAWSPPGSPQVEHGAAVAEAHKKRRTSMANLFRGPGDTELNKDVLNNITMFRRKQKKGTIDVWWLYDDGGLTLLVPYILTTHSQWSGCKLRVFTLANRKNELDLEQRSMASLLAKFRIEYSEVIVIPDVAKKAAESSRMEFDQLIEDFRAENKDEVDKQDDTVMISEAEFLGQWEKTNRHLRLRELLVENSRNASLVVMTLPMPRKSVSAPLYMAWLETLTRDMPPFVLIRGNQTSVLTFYS